MTRVFIAITLTPEITAKVQEVIRKLKEKFPPVRWGNPQKVHLTLAFLGSLPEEKLKTLSQTLQLIAQGYRPFELQISGLSYFYKRHADSIIFLKVDDPTKLLKELYRKLSKMLLARNLFLPKKLVTHLTIGRLKRQRFPHKLKQNLSEIARVEVKPVGSFLVSSVELYESRYRQDINTTQYHLIKSFLFLSKALVRTVPEDGEIKPAQF